MNLKCVSFKHSSGPLFTQAKSRGHEIVRAQKGCPKAVPRHFHNHGPEVTTPEVTSSKVIGDRGPQLKSYFNEFICYLCTFLTLDKI